MNKQTSIKIMLGLLVAVIIFHLCIILKFIPYDIAWGGNLTNDNEMYVFEIISVFINLLLCYVLLIKGEFVKGLIPLKIVDIFLWLFLVLFGLNTVGNAFAETTFEKFFSIITLLFVFLLWIILREKDSPKK
ncbi:MAG: hypothetical protein CVV25_03385 [Ignavibacteriae bacterium HGW-Ignavibacteriae-4]|nr:MAG: hypothetical protein CVV25_03385 [Ignavibacteriae bacterium HGW-Ignavibacteriae-4]